MEPSAGAERVPVEYHPVSPLAKNEFLSVKSPEGKLLQFPGKRKNEEEPDIEFDVAGAEKARAMEDLEKAAQLNYEADIHLVKGEQAAAEATTQQAEFIRKKAIEVLNPPVKEDEGVDEDVLSVKRSDEEPEAKSIAT